jgi:hypothetical protein
MTKSPPFPVLAARALEELAARATAKAKAKADPSVDFFDRRKQDAFAWGDLVMTTGFRGERCRKSHATSARRCHYEERFARQALDNKRAGCIL